VIPRSLVLSFTYLRREWRSGGLRLLFFALWIAVTSISSVSFFTNRVQAVLQDQARELIAADRLLSSSRKPDPHWLDQARTLGLATAISVRFPSVVLAGDATQLASIKAVSNRYPLRGKLRITQQAYAEGTEVNHGPSAGEVWLDARLFSALHLHIGEHVQVGLAQLPVTQVLSYEPDRGGEFFNIAPRLMMNLDDLPATGLITPASRVHYQLYLKGDPKSLDRFQQWLQPQLLPNEEWQGVSEARPELRVALDRARQFLSLAALVAVLISGVAIAIAARRYSQRQMDYVAMLRSLGAQPGFIMGLYSWQLFWFGLLTSLLGVITGYLAQEALAHVLAGLVSGPLPAPDATPFVLGILEGLLILCGFALPSLLRLQGTPPLRVMRRSMEPPGAGTWLLYGLASLAMILLTQLQVHDFKLTMIFFGGSVATMLGLLACARILIVFIKRVRGRVGVSWRFGLANIARRPVSASLQALGFGLGIMSLLLLGLIRSDLLSDWQDRIPEGAPNQFAINIQPDQVADIEAFFARERRAPPHLYPMIRARLVAINDQPVERDNYTSPRAQRLATREFNLSWYPHLQEFNRITAGRWWSTNDQAPMFSVDEGIAGTLGIKLGDILHFDIAGTAIQAPVTSLRFVQWDSFRPNFFVVARPGMLNDLPTTYICSFYLQASEREFLNRLVRAFPNMTLIDVQAIMSQVRGIMDQVSEALQIVFLFTLAAGIIVLLAAIQSTQEERLREGAILRTLGARRSQIWTGILAEFLTLGCLAGILATLGANLIAYLVANQVLNLEFRFHASWWWVALAAGTFGIGLAGSLGVYWSLRRTPMQLLARE